MALNKIGDSVKAQLASIFASESSAPAQKQGRADKSKGSEHAKRPGSPLPMPFEKPQAAWLQNAHNIRQAR